MFYPRNRRKLMTNLRRRCTGFLRPDILPTAERQTGPHVCDHFFGLGIFLDCNATICSTGSALSGGGCPLAERKGVQSKPWAGYYLQHMPSIRGSAYDVVESRRTYACRGNAVMHHQVTPEIGLWEVVPIQLYDDLAGIPLPHDVHVLGLVNQE